MAGSCSRRNHSSKVRWAFGHRIPIVVRVRGCSHGLEQIMKWQKLAAVLAVAGALAATPLTFNSGHDSGVSPATAEAQGYGGRTGPGQGLARCGAQVGALCTMQLRSCGFTEVRGP